MKGNRGVAQAGVAPIEGERLYSSGRQATGGQHGACLEGRRPRANRTVRFEGATYGTDISFFAVDNEPGDGPALHVHPYPETWFVRSGRAQIVAGDESFEVGPGDIAVVPGGVAHKFTNLGPDRLVLFCVHAAGTMEQKNLH